MQIDGIKGPLSTTLKIVTLFKGFASVPALFRAQTKLNTGTKQMPNQARKTSMLVGENSLTWLKNAAMKSTYKSEPCVKHLGHMGCPSETCSFPPKRGLLIGVLDSVTLKWRHSGPKVKMSLAWGETNLWGEWDSSSVSATNSQPSALLPTSPPPATLQTGIGIPLYFLLLPWTPKIRLFTRKWMREALLCFVLVCVFLLQWTAIQFRHLKGKKWSHELISLRNLRI